MRERKEQEILTVQKNSFLQVMFAWFMRTERNQRLLQEVQRLTS